MGTFVQKQTTNTGGGTSVTVTPGAALTAGNLAAIFITYAESSSRSISTVKDQSNNSLAFSEVGTGIFDASNGDGMRLIVIANLPSGITGITITMSAASGFGLCAELLEFSGLKTSSVVGGSTSQSQSGVGTSADAVTSGSFAPGGASGIVIAGTHNDSNSSTVNAGSGFTSGDILMTSGLAEYKAFSANPSTVAGTFTATASGKSYITIAASLLDATAGGAVTLPKGLHGGFGNLVGGFRG